MKKISELEKKRLAANAVITGKMKYKQVGKDRLCKCFGVKIRATDNRLKFPDIIPLGDLWSLVALLDLSDQEIVQIVRGRLEV